MKDLLSFLWRGCVFFLKVVGVVGVIALVGILFPFIIIVVYLGVSDYVDWLEWNLPTSKRRLITTKDSIDRHG